MSKYHGRPLTAPDPEANKSKQHTLIIKDNFFNPAPTS
jgi:hypothetical protein